MQSAIRTYSGKHAIDKAAAQKFIQSQLSPVRTQAAKDLVENTVYITLQEVAEIVERLVLKLYSFEAIHSAKRIYLYTGRPDKSFYFISILAVFFLKKHKLKMPAHFIRELSPDIFDTIGDDPLLLLDDVSYSGSQLSTMLGNIYYELVVKQKKPAPAIFVGLIALNHFSKETLSQVPIKKSRRGETLEYQASPFQLVYLEERLYTPLIMTIGIERYFYVNLFFSPYTESTPYVSMYLDHKIADEASTYTNALTYGPIVPSRYDYAHFFTTIDYLWEFVPSRRLFGFDPAKRDQLFADFNQENNTKFSHTTDINVFLVKKLDKNDRFVEEAALPLQFSPFIRTCKNAPTFKDPEIAGLDYILFVAPEGCIDKTAKCALSNEGILWYLDEWFDTKKSNVSREEAIRISKKINEHRCPVSWYKTGIFTTFPPYESGLPI